jgi:hypothetical protein
MSRRRGQDPRLADAAQVRAAELVVADVFEGTTVLADEETEWHEPTPEVRVQRRRAPVDLREGEFPVRAVSVQPRAVPHPPSAASSDGW